MTLFDCSTGSIGKVTEINGGDQTRRRLVDLGLLNARYHVRARNKHSVLVDFGSASCVIRSDVAANIKILER
ncbi:MAG: ferrous iron transport protein A [Clostridiales bacterium]|nr:ferrous iron transport protein A [Clostridiales bacterium]